MTDQTLRREIAEALLARIKQAVVEPARLWSGATTSLLAATEYDLADVVLAVLATRDAARQAAGQPAATEGHRPPCVEGDHCGEDAAHCPPTMSATEAAAGQPAADEGECAMPRFMDCGCNHLTGCQHPTSAAGLAAPTNHNTEQRARARLAALIGYEPGEHDAKFEQHLDAYRAAILNSAATEPPLTAAERKFLAWALGCAAAVMLSEDGFTDEDEAALASLRRLAAGAES